MTTKKKTTKKVATKKAPEMMGVALPTADGLDAAQIPRDAQCGEDAPLGRLSAAATALDCVDRARRNACAIRELRLCPAPSLTCRANPVHESTPRNHWGNTG